MKRIKNIEKLLLHFCISAILLGLASCEEITIGDKFLSQTPETVGFPLDSMFSNQVNAETVLARAYSYNLPPLCVSHQLTFGKTSIEMITDLGIQWFAETGAQNFIYPGTLNASNAGNVMSFFRYGNDFSFECIRYAYLFLENLDKVPNMSAELKTIRKGEANLLIALRYFIMLRDVGGVPWVPKAYSVDKLPKTFPRMTVEEQVNKIDSLCDLAASQLLWSNSSPNDYMRFNKASAMGLKVKLLLDAARPLFNSNEPYHPDGAKNRYTWYGNYSVDRWKRAEAAGKSFMDALNANGYYNLIQPKGNTHDNYREAFADGYGTRMMGPGNTEALISWLPVFQDTNGSVVTSYSPNVILLWNSAYWAKTTSTLEFVNMFPFKDGTDFPENFDWSKPPFNPWFDAQGNPSRDPRLYETIIINGDRYASRKAETWDIGNGYARGREAVAVTGVGTFKHRKFLRESSNATTWNKPIQISFLRLPEVFLSYAEALNEANGGPNATAYDMVNRVRNRVGLPNLTLGLTQVKFREAVIRERALEFYMEQQPWYDIKFWKQDDRLRKRLHSMQILKTNKTNVWIYNIFEPRERYWWTAWDSKWLMWPFPQGEIDKDYGLVQNPGW